MVPSPFLLPGSSSQTWGASSGPTRRGKGRRKGVPRRMVSVPTPRLTEGAEPGLEYAPFDDDDGPVDCDCPAACYRGHRGYRSAAAAGCPRSPPPPRPSPPGPSTGLAARHRPLPRKRRKRKAPRLAGAGREGGVPSR
ncbi:hypothetical protein P7K49_004182 [Saguinus oedipus]|uniref:Uncharacterized protein n=1 Tax=Saguinus oedipus TaxID=9490 RepID=A0ABQ9W6N8_SAGOE|nr:hypothetical protein P7K49_004182 [Saguinus oedipus]